MTELLLLRHSIAEGNQDKRYLGCRTDTLLRPEGEALAQEKAPKLPPCQALYTSSMLRALQTGCILFPHLEPQIIPGMEEMDFGDFENKNYPELKDDPRYQAWLTSNGTAPFPGGESREDYTGRVLAGYADLRRRLAEAPVERAALVAHGGTLMAILSSLANRKKDYFSWMAPPCGGWLCRMEPDGTLTVLEKV